MRTPSVGNQVNFVDAADKNGGERQYPALVTRNENGQIDLVYVDDRGTVKTEKKVVHASNREHISKEEVIEFKRYGKTVANGKAPTVIRQVAQGRFWF